MAVITMDYNFEVLRGWPQDSALDDVVAIPGGLSVAAGDAVKIGASGLAKSVAGDLASNCGWVVRGNTDSISGAAVAKATVIWSNFIARTTKVVQATAYAVGDSLKIGATAGLLDKATLPADNALVVAVVKAVDTLADGTKVLTIIVK